VDQFPTWSPDGKWIAFHSNRAGDFDVWAMPASGGEAVQVTSGPKSDMRPAWSPDGKRIAFTSDRGGSQDIWVLEAK
jgi:Tol biopolymer transport system component